MDSLSRALSVRQQARVSLVTGDTAAVIAGLQQATTVCPALPLLWEELALLYEATDNVVEAERALQAGLAACTEESAQSTSPATLSPAAGAAYRLQLRLAAFSLRVKKLKAATDGIAAATTAVLPSATGAPRKSTATLDLVHCVLLLRARRWAKLAEVSKAIAAQDPSLELAQFFVEASVIGESEKAKK